MLYISPSPDNFVCLIVTSLQGTQGMPHVGEQFTGEFCTSHTLSYFFTSFAIFPQGNINIPLKISCIFLQLFVRSHVFAASLRVDTDLVYVFPAQGNSERKIKILTKFLYSVNFQQTLHQDNQIPNIVFCEF